MKTTEITWTGKRLTIRHEAGERLTAAQKYYIILTMIGCAAACFIVSVLSSAL